MSSWTDRHIIKVYDRKSNSSFSAQRIFVTTGHQLAADIFGAIINANARRHAAPFDDPVQAADHAFGRQRKVDLNAKTAKTFAIEVIQHIQQPERPAIPSRSAMKSIDQDMFGAGVRPRCQACPGAAAGGA